MFRKSLLALSVVLATELAAQTILLTPSVTTFNPAGGTLTFNATFVYSTPPSVLAFSATLPAGWTYSASAISNEPPVRPADSTTGTLSWAYITTPASPATFSFNVTYPASLTGLQPLSTSTVTRDTAGSSAVTTTGPTVKLAVPTATATWNSVTGNWTTAAAWTPGVVPNNGTPANSTYSASISGGAATVDSPITINDLVFLGGTINGLSTSTLTIAGSGSNWTGGLFSGLNQLVIAPDALFTASGFGNHDFPNTTIINNGQFIWLNGGPLRSGGTPGGAFINSAGATFTDASSGTTPYVIANTGVGGTFTFSNAGSFVKVTTTSTTQVQVPFANTGNILLNGGTLAFTSTFTQNGGLLSLASGTTAAFTNPVTFTAGSVIGSGTISGNVTNGAATGTANSALLSPGSIFGQLTIMGNLSLLNTSKLLFDLGGTTQGVTYDFLSVSGSAALGGTLALNLASSFKSAIQSGDSFTLLTASSFSGAFANVTSGARLLTADGSGSFLVNFAATSLTTSLIVSNFQFTPVPEPSTWALLLLGTGALAVGARRRRRS
jgi:hypothetical protein